MPKTKAKKKNSRNIVPYVSGFRPPSRRAIVSAGKTEHTKGEEMALAAGLWSPLPQCTSVDDWLAQYAEPGQSFNQFRGLKSSSFSSLMISAEHLAAHFSRFL